MTGRSRATAAAGLAAAAALLVGCGAPTVTADRLNGAVGVAFSRLYVLQQNMLGHQTDPPDTAAHCGRTGSTSASGAGAWTCTVHFPYPDGHVEPLSFDVDVAPTGCYIASGPPAALGQQRLQATDGTSVTNPLLTFDGCFDPG